MGCSRADGSAVCRRAGDRAAQTFSEKAPGNGVAIIVSAILDERRFSRLSSLLAQNLNSLSVAPPARSRRFDDRRNT
jgi:hypothetical protein